MLESRAAMHLDTVFHLADRDVVTIYPDRQHHHPVHPGRSGDDGGVVTEESRSSVDVVAAALGLPGPAGRRDGRHPLRPERQQGTAEPVAVSARRGVRL